MLVDTNVLIDIFVDDPIWADWSTMQLRQQAQLHPLLINPIIYAELSLAFASVERLDHTLANIGVTLTEIPKPGLFLAGKALARYRQQGGTRNKILADFFIGAHAAVAGLPVLTRDPKPYLSYFPTVQVIAPTLNEDPSAGSPRIGPKSPTGIT